MLGDPLHSSWQQIVGLVLNGPEADNIPELVVGHQDFVLIDAKEIANATQASV